MLICCPGRVSADLFILQARGSTRMSMKVPAHLYNQARCMLGLVTQHQLGLGGAWHGSSSILGYFLGLMLSKGSRAVACSLCEPGVLWCITAAGGHLSPVHIVYRCSSLYCGSTYDILTFRWRDSDPNSVVFRPNFEIWSVSRLTICCTILSTDAERWQHLCSRISSIRSDCQRKHLIQCLTIYCIVICLFIISYSYSSYDIFNLRWVHQNISVCILLSFFSSLLWV